MSTRHKILLLAMAVAATEIRMQQELAAADIRVELARLEGYLRGTAAALATPHQQTGRRRK